VTQASSTASPLADSRAEVADTDNDAAPAPLTARPVRWLRLRCNGQIYALELLKVQEVVRPAPLLSLRGTSPALLGVMNLRGQVVPLLDLGRYLDHTAPPCELVLDAQNAANTSTRIVVIEERGEVMGLLVPEVEDVTNLHPHQIEPPGYARPGNGDDLFCGIARQDSRTLILLNASMLLLAS